MVREYNFSRSQSGILLARDAPSMDVPARPLTNHSINFTNISFDREVELLRGSVFDDSVMGGKQSSIGESRVGHNIDNIESRYMSAQLILDDLSSRPLTRQSSRRLDIQQSESRIHMYNLQNNEEHKLKVPFFEAPEKPDDLKSGDNSSEFLPLTDEEILIVNQGANKNGAKR